MTVDECAGRLDDIVAAVVMGASSEEAHVAFLVELLALVRSKSEQCAAVVRNFGWPAEYDDHRDSLVAAILATSPDRKRDRARCDICRSEELVDVAQCVRWGWPMCCAQEMELVTTSPGKGSG